ncbi:hypothetical protein CEXT_173771 [Caerostris extrusa]|uniref:Uncharacterized protein n=1 Tax=Caerostris extrusa TaxID=172846 RepID=A0AAV4QID8_CAEEX|nr:hypothetical protein CEXT_173771 [Caerostris extrusa]
MGNHIVIIKFQRCVIASQLLPPFQVCLPSPTHPSTLNSGQLGTFASQSTSHGHPVTYRAETMWVCGPGKMIPLMKKRKTGSGGAICRDHLEERLTESFISLSSLEQCIPSSRMNNSV